jgi:hypothetical protein
MTPANTNTHEDAELQKIWGLIDDHFDTALLSDEDTDEIDSAILALIHSREQAAELRGKSDAAEFFRGTLSDRELRELSKTTLRTWQMYAENLQATKPEKGTEE